MSKKCSVCEHYNVKEINKKLILGHPATEVARHFDMPYDAVWRHGKNHISDRERMKVQREQQLPLTDQLTKLKEHLETAEEEFKRARKSSRANNAQGWLREIRLILQQISEIHSNIDKSQPTNKESQSNVSQEDMEKYWKKLSEVERQIMDLLTSKMLGETKESIPNTPGTRLDEIVPNHFAARAVE
mgnify:CR=1 FL=1